MTTQKNPTQDLLSLARDVARMELAAVNAGISYWSGWADSSATFARATNKELIAVTKGGVKVSEVVSRLADSSREFLNRQVALPVEAIAEFKATFEKASTQPRARTEKASGHSRGRTEKAKR
jgi:hypothetical protein